MIWLDLMFSATLLLTSSLSAVELSLKANIAYHHALHTINAYEGSRPSASIVS